MRRVYLLFVLLFLSSGVLMAQNDAQKRKIISQTNVTALDAMSKKFEAKAKSDKAEAIELAKTKGWTIKQDTNGVYTELMRITPDGQPIYYTTYNVDAAKSSRANFLHNNGGLGLNIEGQGMTAHVWDAGLARTTHQEYDGAGGNNRFSIGDGTTTTHYHSAHVTGTIIASGYDPYAKGMAPQAKAVGYEWNNDVAEVTTAAASGMLLSNHSYGYTASAIPDSWFGQYGDDAHDFDAVMYNAPYYLMCVAAGNDGDDNSSNGTPLDGNSSYDKLSGHATAKNNMVVANCQDADIDAGGNLVSVTINSSSSEGPTDDYRIKPDITGNGTQLYSTYDDADDSYASITGTSMATPSVTGTLLLLQQYYYSLNSSYMRAATLKGLALHTADDAGPAGPDAVYGWGLINAKRAAQTIKKVGDGSIISELTLSNGGSYSITVTASGLEDLIASISWTDPAGTVNTGTNSTTPALVNDLDIRVTQNTDTYYPYKLTSITTNSTGDNIVDPYERINVSNPSGSYTITVTHKGTLSAAQKYTLIITGCVETPKAPEANFAADDVYPIVDNQTVTLTDLTENSPTSWSWTITPATYTFVNGTDATSQNPQVIFNAAGFYTVSLTATNAYGSDTETKVDYIEATTTCSICPSYGTTDYSFSITNVDFNTISNASAKPTDANGHAYSDYTSISTNVTALNTYSLDITLDTYGGYPTAAMAWIDWNQDCDFDDPGEEYDLGSGSTDGASPSYCPLDITVPGYAKGGNTLMRISCDYSSVGGPCERDLYGEVEDYTLIVTPIPPSTVTSVTPNSGVIYKDGGKDITIIGTNLTDAVVTVGGVEARILSNTATQIDIELAGGNYSGNDIVVTCPGPDGVVTVATTFTYDTRNTIPVGGGVDGHSTFQYGLDGLYGWWGTTAFDATKTIDVYAGTYSEEVTVQSDLNPTSTNRLVIQNHSGDVVSVDASGNNYGINLNTTDYVTLSGFSVYNAVTADIYAQGNYDVIQYNKAYASAGDNSSYGGLSGATGIRIETGTNISVLNNILYSNSLYGIVVNSDNNIIKNNTMYDNGSYYTPKTGQSIFYDDFESADGTAADISNWSATGTGTLSGFSSTNAANYVSAYHMMGVNGLASMYINSDPIDVTGYNTLSISGWARSLVGTSALQNNTCTFQYSFDNSTWTTIGTTISTKLTTTYAQLSATSVTPTSNTLYLRINAVIARKNTSDDVSDEYWLFDDVIVTGNETVSAYYAGSGVNILTGASNVIENNISYAKSGSTTYYSLNTNGNTVASAYNNYYSPNTGNAPVYNGSAAVTVAAWTGAGTDDLSGDPLFVSAGTDFHIKSTAGSYAGGEWPPLTTVSGTWTNDASDSPSLDKGNTTDDYSNEPQSGNRINQGAYGNTVQASKTLSCTAPTAPTSVSATSTDICSGESVDLTYTGGSGDSFVWYTDGCGTTLEGSGNNYTVTPSATTTYYGRWETASCGESTCASVTITVAPVSVGGAVSGGTTICSGSTSGLLTLSGQTGDVVKWQYSTDLSTWVDISNTSTTYTSGSLTQTTYFRAVVQSGTCSVANSDYTTVTVTPLVGSAGSITGSVSVCENESGVIYTISSVTNATDYTWTVPTGASITAGQGTTSITVTFGTTSGNVAVTPSNSCGDGTASSLLVTVSSCSGTYTVSGVLTYDDAISTPINGVSVSLTGSGLSDVTTAADGSYSFSNVSDGSYTVEPDLTLTWGGVTAMDVTLYKKEIGAPGTTLSGIRKASGDVNISGDLSGSGLTASDMTQILQRIVTMISAYSGGKDWIVESGAVTVSGSNQTLDLKTLCYGDANASRFGAKSVTSFNHQVEGEIVVNNEDYFEIPLKIEGKISDLASVTFEIPIDPQKVEITDISMANDSYNMIYYINNNILKIVYSSLNPSSYNNSDLLYIKGYVKGINGQINILENALAEFGDINDNQLYDVNIVSPVLSSSATLINDKTSNITIYPNPVTSYLTVVNAENTVAEVVNVLGSVLITQNLSSHNSRIDASSLSPGSYFIRIYKDNEVIVKQFIVLK